MCSKPDKKKSEEELGEKEDLSPSTSDKLKEKAENVSDEDSLQGINTESHLEDI